MRPAPGGKVITPVVDFADLHCEPKASGLRDLRIFDWLDETPAST